jgi:hypothetical protein
MHPTSHAALRITTLCGLIVSLMLSWARAQEKPQTEDLNSPGEEHRKLEALAGTWDVTVKFPAGPGKTMEGKSSCEASWVMDGRFLRQEYSSNFAGKPLTVVRYLGFDRHKGKFVEVHFESTHTDVLYSEGVLSPDSKTITSSGTHVDATTGRRMAVRTMTTFGNRDAFTLEMLYTDGEGKGSKTITLTHRRKN